MQASIIVRIMQVLARMPVVAVLCLIATPALSAAPSISIFGSFFPSWLICLFIGVIATVIIRGIFVLIGVDDIMLWRVAIYMSMALGLTLLFSYLFFGR